MRPAFLIALSIGLALPLRAATTHLFAFEDHSLPFKSNLNLTVEPPQKYSANPVVPPGLPGSVASFAIRVRVTGTDASRIKFFGERIACAGYLE